ncbi:glycosyltransferase family 2 protein [Actinomycetospora rhizophila]|uniref:Glycosyltransferase family 2 protein n=1 Tax=Actinomycetospora rhizophila TaxID=1416876 RepID=A0ABV9ZKJ3_9PSEU
MAFVIAALNEERHIEECVRSLLDQDYPGEGIEVVVVDGGSTDRTREIVEALSGADPRVRLLHNPRRIAPAAFNIGIAGTAAELVSLVSAHSTTDPRYAAVLVEAFDASGASLVGGRETAEAVSGAGPMAEAIVRATASPLGQGPAQYHYSERPGWVDTAYPGAYRRELLDEIGGFDESLIRNQDDELHFRARLAGHRMWFEPRLRSSYRPRPALGALWRQYYQYGWWRLATLRKHGRVASLRHLVPAALVAGVVGGPLLALVGPRRPLLGTWAGGIVVWLGVLGYAGWRERDHGTAVAGRVPIAVACLHLGYGCGFWHAVASSLPRPGPVHS